MKEKLVQFNNDIRALYTKHHDKFVAANDCIIKSDFAGFNNTYEKEDQPTLAEMCKAQHGAYNNLYAEYNSLRSHFRQMLLSVSEMRTMEDMERLAKVAKQILLAQNLVDSGAKTPEEVMAILADENKQQGIVTQNDKIIV